MQVVSVRDFGAFVRVPGFDKDGLVHVSQVNDAMSGTLNVSTFTTFSHSCWTASSRASFHNAGSWTSFVTLLRRVRCVFLTQLGTGRRVERAQDVISEGMTVHVKVRRAVRE